jgi:hypothetical protein
MHTDGQPSAHTDIDTSTDTPTLKKRLSIILENLVEELTFFGDEYVTSENHVINDFDLYLTLLTSLANKKDREDFYGTLKLIDEEISKEGETPTTKNLRKRIKDIMEKPDLIQGELFPLFIPPKSVELKKEFTLNFGRLDKIEKTYKHLLKKELSSGLTLQQHIDKVRDWFNSLHGENLGNWIKLFAFAKAVKEYSNSGNEAMNFREVGSGRYCFRIKKDKYFFEFFIRRDKNTRQFTTKAKKQFLKWLHDNQNTVEFPMIIDKELWNVPIRIYEYVEGISNNDIFFTINTNILESSFKDYVSIDIGEIDAIEELWEGIAAQNGTFATYRLNSFIDIPLKFLLALKQVYTSEGDFTAKKSGYEGNQQHLKGETLNNHLGNLSDRINRHLQSRGKAGSKKSKITGDITKILLNAVWEISLKRKWLRNEPTIDENGTWHFNINPAYFAKQTTAKKLKTATKRTTKRLQSP